MGHPAFLGSFVSSPTGGIAHDVMYGTLMRYAGADLTIFPNYGGRFSFSEAECASIADASHRPVAGFRPIFPTPGGGMTMSRIGEIVEFYGNDVALLIGGDLHRGRSLRSSAEAFRSAIE
jgi:ribulose-bisphosphate carboxylase large chain